MSEVATVFGPEPELDEVRYATIITTPDVDGNYAKGACQQSLYLFRKGTELEEAYQQTQTLFNDTPGAVAAFVCEVFVKDQLVTE